MSELRSDPLTGRSVVIAQGRADRPNEFEASPRTGAPATRKYYADCPFCAGNESRTPEAALEVGQPGCWRVRVTPNKYPLCAPPDAKGGLVGAHEVIIESREHLESTAPLGVGGLKEVLGVYVARLDHWRGHERFPFRMIFKNVGPSAGASLSHLHSQFLALPNLSQQLTVEMANVRRAEQPHLAWPRWLEEELNDGARVVAQSEQFVVFCPRVGRGPLETWVMPRERCPWFEESLSEDTAREELAKLLLPVVQRLEDRITPWGYNMILSTSPTEAEYADVFCWRVELLPRTASLAGFELGTGLYLSTMAPEDAAAELRG